MKKKMSGNALFLKEYVILMSVILLYFIVAVIFTNYLTPGFDRFIWLIQHINDYLIVFKYWLLGQQPPL